MAHVENQSGKKIKCLRTDNGLEYLGQQFQDFLKKSGIRHERTVPYNPQQNGSSERMNRTIEEKARCLLADSGLDKRFWAEAASTAVYLANRSPTKGSPATPLEMFFGKRPNLSHLRVFGSKVMAYVPKEKRKKWDAKSIPCVLVGYAEYTKGYRVFNPVTKQVFVSRDIIILSEACQAGHAEAEVAPYCEDTGAIVQSDEANDSVQTEPAEVVEDTDTELEPEAVEDLEASCLGEEAVQPSALPPHPTRDSVHPTPRRSERERHRPGKYSDYKVTYSVLPQKLVSSQDCGSQAAFKKHRAPVTSQRRRCWSATNF
ncbi:hypothetical protein RP20_CCG026207 [Aedes albopictus]|nr:hypothetical protein RP20_CCG026207 [Aedes albopictus]